MNISQITFSKRPNLLILILLFTSFAQLLSQNNNCKSSLKELEKVLSEKDVYENLKKERIAQLENSIKDAKEYQLYTLYHKLYLEYELYNFDVAYMYMSKMLDIAEAAGDHDRIIRCKLNLSYCCVSAGLFFEANDILREVETMKLDGSLRTMMYSVYAKLYFDMARSIVTEQHSLDYYQKSIYYTNEIINTYNKDDLAILPQLANIYRCRKDYKEASEVITHYMSLKELDQRSLTLCAGGLGEFSLMLGDTISAVEYLCFSSIEDIKAVTKETPGLSLLAGIMYKQGKIEKAFNFAQMALDDANFYNAQHRKIEVNNVLPIIDVQRYALLEKQKNIFFANTILLSVLLVLSSISASIIFKQVKQLKNARKKIEHQNEKLVQINSFLEEANKVKEEYIGLLFRLNSAYMRDLEEFQTFVKRKLVAKLYDDLLRTINKTDIKKERENKLSAFDDIILKLFPNFVKQFNSLFDDGNQFVSGVGNWDLTPEMRIFALIRLGVNDSEEIAKILNYSVHTINTYKTKAKNRSLVTNEEFEDKIKSIIKHID